MDDVAIVALSGDLTFCYYSCLPSEIFLCFCSRRYLCYSPRCVSLSSLMHAPLCCYIFYSLESLYPSCLARSNIIDNTLVKRLDRSSENILHREVTLSDAPHRLFGQPDTDTLDKCIDHATTSAFSQSHILRAGTGIYPCFGFRSPFCSHPRRVSPGGVLDEYVT